MTQKIAFNKKKLLLVFGIFLIVLSYGLYLFKLYFDKIIAYNSMRLLLSIIVVLLLILLATLYFAYKLIKPNTYLIIDNEGITDESNIIYSGKIHWKHIKKIGLNENQKEKLLLVFLYEPHYYFNKLNGRVKQMLLHSNQMYYGTGFVINLKIYKYDSKELTNLIQNEFKKHETINKRHFTK